MLGAKKTTKEPGTCIKNRQGDPRHDSVLTSCRYDSYRLSSAKTSFFKANYFNAQGKSPEE
jgi:hypothetical protein